MKIQDDHEVEESEQVARFVCGAILGALVGLALIFVCGIVSLAGLIFGLVVPMIAFGLMALYWGDRFWEEVIEWLIWFR